MLRFTPTADVALVLVDIDDFKGVNDRFTHVVGDEVLRRVAGVAGPGLRVGDRLVRYGGDEFVVLLPRTGDQEARQVAGRMATAIARLPWAELADGLEVRVTTGCAALWSLTGRRPDRDAEHLFRRADEALLEAKRRRGRPHAAVSGACRREPAAAAVARPTVHAGPAGPLEPRQAHPTPQTPPTPSAALHDPVPASPPAQRRRPGRPTPWPAQRAGDGRRSST